jgi:putative NADH-flavin reductase
MKVLVIGAAGRIGGLCVQQALDAGHHVFALARNPAKISMPSSTDRLEHLKGDALVAVDIDAAFASVRPEAVISTVGLSSDSPKDLVSRLAKNVVTSARSHGTRRIVVLAGIQVFDEGDGQLPLEFRCWGFLFRYILGLGSALADSAAMLKWLRADCKDLDWTVARPSLFQDGPSKINDTNELYAGPVATVGRSIQTIDLAKWLVAQVALDGPYKHAAPALSNK